MMSDLDILSTVAIAAMPVGDLGVEPGVTTPGASHRRSAAVANDGSLPNASDGGNVRYSPLVPIGQS